MDLALRAAWRRAPLLALLLLAVVFGNTPAQLSSPAQALRALAGLRVKAAPSAFAAAVELEGFDEEEEESQDVELPSKREVDPERQAFVQDSELDEEFGISGDSAQEVSVGAEGPHTDGTDQGPEGDRKTRAQAGQQDDGNTNAPDSTKAIAAKFGPREGFFVALLVLSGIIYFVGRRANERIVGAWGGAFCKDGQVLHKNFSLVGPGSNDYGDGVIIKHSPSSFTLWASGRRYCQSLEATLELKRRQDLLSHVGYVINPEDDKLLIDIHMKEEAMEPFVFAIAQRKQARALRECRDIASLARPVVAQDKRKKWNSKDFVVFSEFADIFPSLISETLIDAIFAESSMAEHGKYFQRLHISDQFPGAKKTMIKFLFKMPPAKDMGNLGPLMDMCVHMIDAVGRFKLSSTYREKAKQARAELEEREFKKTLEERAEAVQRKKEERRRQEKEAEAHMSPAALKKKEERDKRRELRKQRPRAKIM